MLSKLKFIRLKLKYIRSELEFIRSKLKFKRLKLKYKRYGFGGGRRPTISGAQLIIWNVEFLTFFY